MLKNILKKIKINKVNRKLYVIPYNDNYLTSKIIVESVKISVILLIIIIIIDLRQGC